jgi:hypothetical protein
MQQHPSRFTKFTVANEQSLQLKIDVLPPQACRLRNAKARGGNESKDRRARGATQPRCRVKHAACSEETSNLIDSKDVRRQTTVRASEESSRRHLGGRVELLAIRGEGSQGLDASRSCQRTVRARIVRPLRRQLHGQWTAMTYAMGKASKTFELRAFGLQRVACAAPINQVSIHLRGERA